MAEVFNLIVDLSAAYSVLQAQIVSAYASKGIINPVESEVVEVCDDIIGSIIVYVVDYVKNKNKMFVDHMEAMAESDTLRLAERSSNSFNSVAEAVRAIQDTELEIMLIISNAVDSFYTLDIKDHYLKNKTLVINLQC